MTSGTSVIAGYDVSSHIREVSWYNYSDLTYYVADLTLSTGTAKNWILSSGIYTKRAVNNPKSSWGLIYIIFSLIIPCCLLRLFRLVWCSTWADDRKRSAHYVCKTSRCSRERNKRCSWCRDHQAWPKETCRQKMRKIQVCTTLYIMLLIIDMAVLMQLYLCARVKIIADWHCCN